MTNLYKRIYTLFEAIAEIEKDDSRLFKNFMTGVTVCFDGLAIVFEDFEVVDNGCMDSERKEIVEFDINNWIDLEEEIFEAYIESNLADKEVKEHERK